MESTKLRIAIDCRINDPLQGIGRAVIALARALSASPMYEQEYTFVVREDVSEWIKPHIYGPCRFEAVSVPESLGSQLKSRLKAVPGLECIWKDIRSHSKRIVSVPTSDGFVESRNFDIVHFPTQQAFLTKIPSIYQPWDLQHIHFPEFFSQVEIGSREKLYRAFCKQAKYVCVQTEWGKKDLVEKLSIEPEKVKVIRWGSVFDAYQPPLSAAVAATSERLQLPKQYFVYPAVTWVHKNHEAIIRALRILKHTHNVKAYVCFSGKCTDFRRDLDRLAIECGVADQIRYLGFIPTEDLQAVYAGAIAMVFPSKFEGFGLPIVEAFQAGLPVLCSNATVLPEVAQDGALYFDPSSPEQLSEHMKSIVDDDGLRSRLIEKGKRILPDYSIGQTAAKFQFLYQQTVSDVGSVFGRICSGEMQSVNK